MIGIKVNKDNKYAYVTLNFRHLIENGWLDDLQYICEPTEFHEKRYTFRLITSIGVTRELNRHRVNSIAEESTRYCNYSKDKFGKELTFIIPNWDMDDVSQAEWINAISNAEESYLSLIEQGWKPQQAREVLPLCLKSEIIHTAFTSDWKHFFDLRYYGTTGAPHPNMKQLTTLMKDELDKANNSN